jgi:hypothetical protein
VVVRLLEDCRTVTEGVGHPRGREALLDQGAQERFH